MALFSLRRCRVQVVDRWLNPARYSADLSFAAQIKDAVDRVAVCDDLLGTVSRALEPAEAQIGTAEGGGRESP